MNYSKEEKAKLLEDWRQSGKKAWTYAKEKGLIPQTFCSWVKRETEQKHGFVEIRQQTIQPTFGIIVEKADVRICIPLGMSSGELHTIMKGIGLAQ